MYKIKSCYKIIINKNLMTKLHYKLKKNWIEIKIKIKCTVKRKPKTHKIIILNKLRTKLKLNKKKSYKVYANEVNSKLLLI